MVTDVKKQIFQTLMQAEDYLQAYENLTRLGLKKTQEREIVKVIVQCCCNEDRFNKFYLLLAKKLCQTDREFQFSFKFTLWDYIRTVEKLGVK